MDRQLAERMVGAACLLLVVVLVVPSILDGNRRPEQGPAPGPQDAGSLDLRTHTISLDGTERSPPVPKARMPEPATVATIAEPAVASPGPESTGFTRADSPADAGPGRIGSAGEALAPSPVKSSAPPKLAPAEPPADHTPEPAADGTPRVATAAAGSDWFVQLGSFSQRDNAERLVADVSRRGFPAGMAESSGRRGPMYRVRVGPAGSREAAGELARKLAAAGFTGQVTRR